MRVGPTEAPLGEPILSCSPQRATPSVRGEVSTRKHARWKLNQRFLSSAQPSEHLSVSQNSLSEYHSDIREDLARETRRELLRKATIDKQLPRLTQATANRERFLREEAHTWKCSEARRRCEEFAIASNLRDGEALTATFKSQQRSLWMDRATAEREDLHMDTKMPNETSALVRDLTGIMKQESDEHPHSSQAFHSDPTGGDQHSGTSPERAAQVGWGTTSDVHVKNTGATTPNICASRTSDVQAGTAKIARKNISEDIWQRQAQIHQLTDAQAQLTKAKKDAVHLMCVADEADKEVEEEAIKLRDYHNAPPHSETTTFDARVNQRRVWLAKSELALQSRLRYQEAVAELHKIQEKWGPALGSFVKSVSSDRNPSPEGIAEATSQEISTGASARSAGESEVISLWVIGIVSTNISSETLGRVYYGCFSESRVVPCQGWMPFEQGMGGITVQCVVPNKPRRNMPIYTGTWIVGGAPFSEVNGRYTEVGSYNGTPRYRNPNNVLLFRHELKPSEELGITRQTCSSDNEMTEKDGKSVVMGLKASMEGEVPSSMSMNFAWLVKNSLQTINLDRQDKIRLNQQLEAHAVSKIDQRLKDEISHASATLSSVEQSERGCHYSASVKTSSAPVIAKEINRDLAIMEASDVAKLTFQEGNGDEDRVISCDHGGDPPLCKRWIARACPKHRIHCRHCPWFINELILQSVLVTTASREDLDEASVFFCLVENKVIGDYSRLCRHYFISHAERDSAMEWRQGRDAQAELEVLSCIAKRETLVSEAEKEVGACLNQFLSKARSTIEERDVSSLLNILDQLRLASVRVVEAVCKWRQDVKRIRLNSLSTSPAQLSLEMGDSIPFDDRRQTKRVSGVRKVANVPFGTGQNWENQPSAGVDDPIRKDVSAHAVEDPARTRNGGAGHRGSGIGGTEHISGNPDRGSQSVDKREPGSSSSNAISRDYAATGRWVVTMMVPGRKLWGSSPAMVSQYKRFRRSRQEPKIAKDQLYLGIFSTKAEALRTYDDALGREAVKQRSSVLRMPKKRVVTRTCGKHIAIQSEDTPPGRSCEQCIVSSLHGGVEHCQPYIWNNSNYLLKMTDDLDFLKSVHPLVSWLGNDFKFQDNPFLLASEYVHQYSESSQFLGMGSTPLENTTLIIPQLVNKSSGSAGPFAASSGIYLPRPDEASLQANRPRSSDDRKLSANGGRDRDSVEAGLLDTEVVEASRECCTTRNVPYREGEGIPISRSIRRIFGRPSTQVTRFSNGIQGWCGKTAANGTYIFPLQAAISGSGPKSSSALVPTGIGPGFEARAGVGIIVETLDKERIKIALGVLQQERDIANAMARKPCGRRRSRRTPDSAESISDAAVTASHEIGGAIGAKETAQSQWQGDEARTPFDSSGFATAADMDVEGGGRGEGVAQNTTRKVLSVYRSRGAQLLLAQTRNRHPFRQEGVFCRADRGEWAGQVHTSVNAKKFVARRMLDKALERRNEQRARTGRAIRKLVQQGQPIHRLRGPRLRALVAKAKNLGGDRLIIDITEAEAALELYDKVESSATIIQAMVRGALGREVSRVYIALRRKEVHRVEILMRVAGVLAEEFVEGALWRTVRRAGRLIRRPATASVRVFQDGRRLIVSAVPVHERSFSGGAPKVAVEWSKLCATCQGRLVQRVWSYKTASEYPFRGVCSCATARPPEAIKLMAYDPITGEQVTTIVSDKTMREVLGKDHPENVRATMLTTAFISAAANLRPLPWDGILRYRTQGMQRRTWEPCLEASRVQDEAEIAQYRWERASRNARQAVDAAMQAEATANTVRALHETWLMNIEDLASNHGDLVLRLKSASAKSSKALELGWRSLGQLEDGAAEDWTQAWDPFENGNNWAELVHKRRTDLALSRLVQAVESAGKSESQAREEWVGLESLYKVRRAKARWLTAVATKGQELFDKLSHQAANARDTAKAALKILTVIARPSVKAAGVLQKTLIITENSHIGAQWDMLYRAGMTLETPTLSYSDLAYAKRHRCVVTIRRDSRTGAVSVTASGHDKAVELHTVTLSADEVVCVVAEKVGGRRGHELVSPITLEGAHAAIRRVQEARCKEVLQILVSVLKLDICEHKLAVGKLSFLRRRRDLDRQLKETLWHKDALGKRSSGRGTEIFRSFYRLGLGWVMISVHETWGDLYFEAYDIAGAFAITLQAGLREILLCLWAHKATATAYLHAVRTGIFPRRLVKQILGYLDVVLPAEDNRWWRRQVDGETPYLRLVSKPGASTYRGPLWTENRYTSGRPVAARVFVSAKGDFLIEMEPQGGDNKNSDRCSGFPVWETGVLRLQVRAQDLRCVFKGYCGQREADAVKISAAVSEHLQKDWLLAPERRVELCRYLLDHVTVEEVPPSLVPGGRRGSPINEQDEAELKAACVIYKEWACSTKAPVDRNPFPEERYNPNSSPGALYLALRPGIESDEHLLPLHEGSWSQDGIHWFHAKICFIHGGCGPRKREANPTSGKYRGEELSTEYSRKAASWNSVSETAGLLVTLRPEGVGQKRVRLEKEARAFMSLEDERSRHVGAIFSRLQKEIKARVTRTQQSAVSLRRASAVAMTQVRWDNRLQTRHDAEEAMEGAWIQQDLKKARLAVPLLFSALRLKVGLSGPSISLISVPTISDSSREHLRIVCEHFLGYSSTKNESESSVFARSLVEEEVGAECNAATISGRGRGLDQSSGNISRLTEHHPPSRQHHLLVRTRPTPQRVHREKMLLGRRRGSCPFGDSLKRRPLMLAQEVLRLQGGEVAIVKAMLHPPGRCDHALPSSHASKHCGITGEHFVANCEVRCVVGIEVYMPGTSKTLSLCARLCSNPVTVDHETPVVVVEAEQDDHLAHSDVCRSRKQQRGVLREERSIVIMETAREKSTALQQDPSTLPDATCCDISGIRVEPSCMVTYNRQKVNNTFSVLLIRANACAPMERASLRSGSWVEMVGELIGCPTGTQPRRLNVRGQAVFALDVGCHAPFNSKAKKIFGVSVHGDALWVKAWAETEVQAMLEAERGFVVSGDEAANASKSGWYHERVHAEALRLLPALPRAYFANGMDLEDIDAAQVRSLLRRVRLFPRMGSGGASNHAARAEPAMGLSRTDDIQPFHSARALLRMHIRTCKIPEAACPVPFCRQARARVLQELDAPKDRDELLLREIDGCLLDYWKSQESKRRAPERKEVPFERDGIVEQNLAPLVPASSSSSANKALPYTRAFEHLLSATALVGKPEAGVSAALDTPGTTITHPTTQWNRRLKSSPAAGAAGEACAVLGKCLVGMGMLSSLIGPDGRDAGGVPVFVNQRSQDINSALQGGQSQRIVDWVLGRLRLKSEGASSQMLSFDRGHCTGAATISGTRLLLTMTQSPDGPITITSHDPLTCEALSMVLDRPTMHRLCAFEGLRTGPMGTGVESAVARYLLRNASRLLKISAFGGVDSLVLAGYYDKEPSSASIQSVSALEGTHIQRFATELPESYEDNDSRNSRRGIDENLFGTPSFRMVGVECRIRRLEVGRRHAKDARRAKTIRELSNAATEWRHMREADIEGRGVLLRMYLTCDTHTLALASTAFGTVSGTNSLSMAAVIQERQFLDLNERVSNAFMRASEHHHGREEESRVGLLEPVPSLDMSLHSADEEEWHSVQHEEQKSSQGMAGRARDPQLLQDSLEIGSSCHTEGPQEMVTEGQNEIDGATLGELQAAVAGLEACIEAGTVNLVAFVGWWACAVSQADIVLKSRFLVPPSAGGR